MGKFGWKRSKDLGESYWSVFYPDKQGTTIRQIDTDLLYGEDTVPELLDISLLKFCDFGCPYCYQEASIERAQKLTLQDLDWLYGQFMDELSRPYQVAYGGGEPTLHPQFTEILKLTYDYKIVPNYTTNGTNLTDKVLQATDDYCGGIAVTYHEWKPEPFWKAIERLKLLSDKTQKNAHIIVTKQNLHKLSTYIKQILDTGVIDFVVLLEFHPVGRGKNFDRLILNPSDKAELVKILSSTDLKHYLPKIAFGASLVPVAISLYGERLDLLNLESITSGYIDENLNLAPSSFWEGPKVPLKLFRNFREAYNSKLFKSLRSKQKQLQSTCKVAYLCNGGMHASSCKNCHLQSKN